MMMLLRLKTLLKAVILPPAGPLLLAILGVLLIKRRPRLARTCLILGLGSLWLLSTPVVSDAVTRLAEHYPPLDLRSTAGAQAIVILGGGGQRVFAPEYGGPAAQPMLLERLHHPPYIPPQTGSPFLAPLLQIKAPPLR